jgi:phosphomannomutase
MSKIKFGTDGWRAIIAEEFTADNVARVTEATAKWLKTQSSLPQSVVVGHDCRFAGELFAETVARVFGAHGIKVWLAKGFVSTPMVSLGTLRHKAGLGIIITASHNPPAYNGFKLKGHYGGPLTPEKVQEIEDIIEDTAPAGYRSVSLKDLSSKGLLEYTDLETMYCEHAEASFDMKLIRESGLRIGYDAMYGAGQNVVRRLLPESTFLHCDHNPSFEGQAPEPIAKNLREFSEVIKLAGNIDIGLATDGDADRIGLFDNEGNFVDSHHIILLLIHYLKKYKGFDGKVATAFSTTVKIKNICRHYNLPLDVVKIGFKYICGIMITEDVLLGGEESGGIAIKGHIPERDGVWMGLVLFEFMAKTGKSLRELINEVYQITGEFAFERNDLHLDEDLKNRIVANCKAGKYQSFGKYKIIRTEDLDGWKYFLNEDEWIMVRASGTEPVLRTYAESSSQEKAFELLEACKETLLTEN